MSENMYIANLGFFLNFGDGSTNDEIESELFRVIIEVKGTRVYDRAKGGSFENLEQEKPRSDVILLHVSQIIESVYRLNEERNFNPYIIVGASDLNAIYEEENKLPVTVKYRLLQDMSTSGEAEIPR